MNSGLQRTLWKLSCIHKYMFTAFCHFITQEATAKNSNIRSLLVKYLGECFKKKKKKIKRCGRATKCLNFCATESEDRLAEWRHFQDTSRILYIFASSHCSIQCRASRSIACDISTFFFHYCWFPRTFAEFDGCICRSVIMKCIWFFY